MPEVRLERALKQPVLPAREALSAILHDIASGHQGWAGFALHLNTGEIGLPDVGYVAVPINLKLGDERSDPRHEIRFKIESQKSAEMFPVFEGAAGIEATGASSSSMWLGGSYVVPIRGLGSLLNATLMRGAALKTLENFLADIAEATEARVERRELARSRYRLLG